MQKKITTGIHADRDWDAKEEGVAIMTKVLRAKFKQVEAFKTKLMETGNSLLAESNPYDRTWGTELDANQTIHTIPSA